MLVLVGSENPVKVEAVKNAFSLYFENVETEGIEVKSGVKEQPTELEEIVQGAKNRAKNAFEKKKCDFSVGIEAGIFKVKGSRTGWMDTAAVSIFDGKEFYLGFTPIFEYPKEILERALEKKITTGKAMEELYNAKDPSREEGIIGIITKGKMPRTKLHEYGIICALTGIINKK